ncbi:uncharacterized protein A4U43_UnF8510 [Asparagus officinalis]|uniref:Auxin transport protein BIG n=1 Tax=Asparagus officinalis TaxID=4686 RepID=A0A1R3L5Y3_ASPOF|nr:uncharacterized protein A4U43_UnF8510 [Asparagus officinalis]
MEEISNLLDLFKDRTPPRDLAHRLRSDSIKPGLFRFLAILDSGARLGLESWSASQIDAVISAAKLLVGSSLSISAESGESVVLVILEKSVDFCLSVLEKLKFDGADFSLQNSLAQLLEVALCAVSFREHGGTYQDHINSYVELLSVIPVKPDSLSLHDDPIFYLQGVNSLKNGSSVEDILKNLSSECLQPDILATQFAESPLPRSIDSTASLAQHWVAIHLKCIPRLLMLCKTLHGSLVSVEIETQDANFSVRLSFSHRILKLIGYLAKEIHLDAFDAELLHAIIGCADTIPTLFRLKMDYVTCSPTSTGNFGGPVLLVLEEFLQLVQVIFLDGHVFQNIRACLLASILDILDSKTWRYDESKSSSRPPLVYWPQIVLHVLKLLKEAKNWASYTHNQKEIPDYLCSSAMGGLSYQIHSEKFHLLKRYTYEEYLRTLFPPSKQWLDDLIHLAFFLHCEGLKLKPKVERFQESCMKTAVTLETDGTAGHEDEAIFGNLFSEASRPAGLSDGLDQPTNTVPDVSSSHLLLIQATTELLGFLKENIFSSEWNFAVYDDACKKIDKSHINFLISLLTCQSSVPDEKYSGNCTALSSQGTHGNVSDLCFDLLQNLLVRRVLSSSLKEHIADQVLKVENGAYIYNNYTLTLLSHALIAQVGLDDSHLTMKIFEAFVGFVLEKAKDISCKCPGANDFFKTLPCTFYLEILLIAFHLSNESDKAVLANYIFSSVRKIDAPKPGFSGRQLLCWAITVSRLVLVLRHMVSYPSACPSWLLLRLKSRLREAPFRAYFSESLIDHVPSWTSIVVESILGDAIKEAADLNLLLSQMIDTVPHPVVACDSAFQALGLNCADIISKFSWILSFWRGRKAETVDQLIVERYIYLLCWGTVFSISPDARNMLPLGSTWAGIDLSNSESFFHFGHIALNDTSAVSKNINLSEVILDLLQRLDREQLPDKLAVPSWDVFRKAAWLSLILSLLHSGICKYAMIHEIPGVEQGWIQPSDGNGFCVAESIIANIFNESKSGLLLRLLSSFLRKYLQVLQEAFLSLVDQKRDYGDGFSSLLLLKHNGFDKNRQEVLLKKCGSSPSLLESLYGLLLKSNEIVAKEDRGNMNSFLLEGVLHGFPVHPDSSSGTLLSSILAVRELVCMLDIYLKVKAAVENIPIETDLACHLLDSVMAVRSDKIFESIHNNCEAIFASLIPRERKLSGLSDLYGLKQIEGLLADINSRQTADAEIHEMLITSLVDIIYGLQHDDSKAAVFQFYVGSDTCVSEEVKELFGQQHGDILVLIDALEKCSLEAVNLKVVNLLVDLLANEQCPALKERLQKKFLGMDLLRLSHWLEIKLLGCTTKSSDGIITAKGSSTALRDSTMELVTRLALQPGDGFSAELHSQFIEAMLMSLDSAFTLHDINSAKAYFSSIIKLLNGESSMKLLVEKTVRLMGNLVGDEALLPGLKFLLSFLGAVLGDLGANKNTSSGLPSKLSASNSFGSGSVLLKSDGSRKDTENLLLPTNAERSSASIECDATSVDEDDDDDGTSDGELGSIYKVEEEECNSERALASKVCTFTSSGSNFVEQHWYFCYTCDLTVSKGCCSICAKVCHRGHRVVYSRSSRFFCDCGAGGVRGSSCQCLKPRKLTGSSSMPAQSTSNFQPFLPFPEDGDPIVDSESDWDDDLCSADIDNFLKLSIPREVQEGLPVMLENLNLEDQVLELCNRLLPTVLNHRESNLSKDKKVLLGDDKVLSYNVDLFQLKKAYKSGSFDLKIKADYPNSRELKSHLASGSLTKSLLSISVRGRLAAGEGDKVAIFDVGQLIGQPTVAPVTADKTNAKPLSKNIVRFEIVHLLFNPVTENYLVVAGYEDCQVLTVNPRGEVTDRLALELALQGAYIRKVEWVPGSQVQLMVVTNMFVKIYDLSQDNISPVHYSTLCDDLIMDATLVPAPMGKVFLLVLSVSGRLFRLQVSMEGDIGAKELSEIIQVQGKSMQSKGLSLHFAASYRLLFLSYQDGTSIMGRLDANAASLSEISAVYEDEQDNKVKPAALHHWRELLPGSGFFACLSSLKSNAALIVSLSPREVLAQHMRYGGGSALPLVGIAAYKPLSKDETHSLVLHDDGSLQIYSHILMGSNTTVNTNPDQTKKIGSSILSNRAYAGSNTEFPLDFFEKTTCITADVKLSCDALKNSDSESIKQRLTSDDGFLESSSAAGFKVTVSNSNPDIVMVGLRIHVGNTSARHIPSEITIFQRVIKLDEGMRSWYDIPFTVAESLLADEEFTVSVGKTFDGSTMPRIDCMEIYGRAKDEFGWKEKMDAVLDMEAHALGVSFGGGVSRKQRIMQTAPVHEQVMADALWLLSRIYSACKLHISAEVEDVHVELNKLKCKNLLEAIFQSDREPLLQSAACLVLQAVFPKKDVYYHVRSLASLWLSQVGVSLRNMSLTSMHIEFISSGVVDGLMQVLWGILDLERPETQTINNIVVPAVELIYSYAECLALHGTEASGRSVVPAVVLLKKLLLAPYEAVQTSSSLAISSRLLQVPFPKQTMLTTDDAAENTVTPNIPSDMSAAAGNAQVMIEEDPATSSVQYCCDGCSTVPILRRRWHCNICPDFDLCEACYEILDADRLPPPHSREHPMSAIPIDALGGDGNEIHFSMDELNDAGLVQVSADLSVQSSPHHVLDTTVSGDFSSSAIDQRIVSISASKRALNSLLLRQLVEELRGWMETTSGIRAIPVMQLFYRLSSAVGGPFMDSSKPENLDLEKFIKWFLDEINLSRPFSAKNRSFFGEVSILVFMFFTLMLRNWHQPGSDSSQSKSGLESQDKGLVQIPLSSSTALSSDNQEKNEFASQLVRACSFLRQQTFLNYLMDILQQLVHVFKSTSLLPESCLSSSSGCGSLLTVRRELPAGNFSPFFSDSYAKAHRADLFMDYHKLLLENTFRLVYSLVRPEKQDKSAEKDKPYKASAGKDLKLDGFQDVLCTYISNPNTTFVRRYARRLFLHLCGSKTHYYSVRDTWQFSMEVKRLYKLANKSGSFRNPVPYEKSVKLVKCLSSMSEAAVARPRNWQKYCSKHIDVLPFLVDGIFYFSEESVIQSLKLLNLAFYTGKEMCHAMQKLEGGDGGTSSNKGGAQPSDPKKKRKGDDGTESSSEKSCIEMDQAVKIFSNNDGCILRRFIDAFLVEWNSTSVRGEAKCVLFGVWHHAKHSFKEFMLTTLLQKVKFLPMYGQNIMEYIELMTWLLGKVPDISAKQPETELINKCLTSDVISCIFETLHSQNELLANHPNSRIYNTLSGLVEFDGYYLESEPCVACSCPEVPYTRMKLESLKSETKYTGNRIIVKCTGSYVIQTVTMNVHDARKSKSVKVLNLYYNNRPVADLSELKNNWSLWKRAKSCHLVFNQTELKVEFPIPITACNFMIELDSFYENLQASSLESLQCPRCSRPVTDKHGICSNCHENAYQCRQCRNINYENLDSFLCNECGYSKYGRFEFNFMAKPSFSFDNMENEEDMRKGLAAIESESENAHRRYQQLLGFKKPLLKLVSSIGENEIDSQQKDTVQQMMVSLPGPSCKINRKIALLGVLYGEKCKAAFDSVSKSVQTLQGLRRVLMTYLHQKNSDSAVASSRFAVSRSPNNCYGCATTFVTQCMELLQVLSKYGYCKKQLVASGILKELFENNIHQGTKTARAQARGVLCAFSEGDANAVLELNTLIQKKVMYCLDHHRSMDIALATREELLLLSETCAVVDEFWESRLRVAFQLLFSSIKLGAKHPAISEHIILPCLRIISQACTPPKTDAGDKDLGTGKHLPILQSKSDNGLNPSVAMSGVPGSTKSAEQSEKHWDGGRKGRDIPLLSYSEWEKGASYLDFVRRQYKVTQSVKVTSQRSRQETQKFDYLALKYGLKWKHNACKRTAKTDFSKFALGSWVSELILSACSQSIRAEVCNLISLLCPQNTSRRLQLLNLLMSLLPATLSVGESAAEYFELFFRMIDSESARLFLTVKGCLTTICRLITQEANNIESQERSLNIDISQGFILHKLIELLSKFLDVSNIRVRFMRDELLSQVLEALLVIRGLIVQKTKLISDCNRVLKDLLDSLLLESTGNKRQFICACISGLQNHAKEKRGRTSLFILEQLCNIICPTKPEPVYLLILNKAHTQEEFIRGSMTKNPYHSTDIGPLMRDVKNKICHQLDLLGLVEDDYGMELLVAGNIISLDLSISQVYEQVWKKHHSQSQNNMSTSATPSSGTFTSVRDYPPMTVTYRLQGLDGEATEPMIKELEEEREEIQDPEVEFAIAGAVRECGGLEIILSMIQCLSDDELKSNQEELSSVLNLLMYCCKIRENRQALLKLGALGLLLETVRRAFSVDAMEPAEGILLIVESLTVEANESDIGITQGVRIISNEESGVGEQAKKIVLMFLERLCHPVGLKKSTKQQRNNEMVARILPYLTYGEPAAMETLIQHFDPYLLNWGEFDHLQRLHQENPKDENVALQAAKQRSALENFVRVSESLGTSSCGERLKDIILGKGIAKIAVGHLTECFAVAGQAGYKSSSEWAYGLKLSSVPLILSMLRGLSKGHLATQRCIDEEGILPLLHALEGVSGENEIGARAENLLDTLADKEGNGDGFLGEKIHKLRHATKDEMRRKALKKREELLQGLGMRREFASDGGERIVVSQPTIEGLEDVEEEEDGLACMVCREGYSLRPNDMLGVYSYSKRVNLGSGSSGSSRGDCVYTTVSHFNIIHFQCHQEAKRADAALKNPKKEWEGATLRNNETLCNCIFPLRGPAVPLAQYVRCVDQYWDNLSALGRADGSRLRLLTYDIVLMLARFATGASFSIDANGGGKESNARLLPFMIQMASYLLHQGTSNSQNQRVSMANSVSTYLSSPLTTTATDSSSKSSPSSLSPARSSEETVQFMMLNSLLSESYEDWCKHRPAFLKRGIYHAYMQHVHGHSSSDTSNLFPIVQPMLVYTGLVEQLQSFFKVKKGSVEGEAEGLERWEVVMKEKLSNVKEMVGLSKELLSWLEEMSSVVDLQEAFDVMGALGDALSGGFSSCEEFVRAAIVAGKS